MLQLVEREHSASLVPLAEIRDPLQAAQVRLDGGGDLLPNIAGEPSGSQFLIARNVQELAESLGIESVEYLESGAFGPRSRSDPDAIQLNQERAVHCSWLPALEDEESGEHVFRCSDLGAEGIDCFEADGPLVEFGEQLPK